MKCAIIVISMTIMLLFASTSLLAQEGNSEPEEPDFAFISGGPYTQKKDSVQFIWANNYSRHFRGGNRVNDFLSTLRIEWGFTDRLEGDLIVGFENVRDKLGSESSKTYRGAIDTILGLRYRFLTEENTPLTLATGPQIIFPTGSKSKGLGSGEVGYAWDLALARDWNKYFFTYASLNYSIIPNVSDPTHGSGKKFTLNNLAWAIALGFRPLEIGTAGGAHHDIHLFAELGGTREQELVERTSTGRRRDFNTRLFAPGFRYGYLTPKKTLVEAGLSFPVGLNNNTPDWGVIFQFQFEFFVMGG